MSHHVELEHPQPTESSGPLALWIAPLVAAVLVPGLWWTAADSPYSFRTDLVITMTLIVAVVAVALLMALSSGLRKRIRWALGVTSVALLIGFQWRTFTVAGENVADTTGVALLSDVIPVLLAGGFLWLAIRLAAEWQFSLVLTIATSAAVVALGLTALSLVAPQPSDIAIQTADPSSPDVLLLVLDGYGRADWLESEFGFDNNRFLDDLESRGFEVASAATSNYGHTYASVSSMLKLDYVFPVGEITHEAREDMRAALAGATGMIAMFREAGYETVYLENTWGGSQCGGAVTTCVRDGLVERSVWTLGQMTILAPTFRMIQPRAFHSVSADHLNSLDDYVSRPQAAAVPRMTFAHILLPHVPLLLDAECKSHRQDDLRRWGPEDGTILATRRLNYAEQAQCVNRKVLEAIDALVEVNPDAVVMITGDHGPGSLLNANLSLSELEQATLEERMRILGAYRLPGCEESFRADLTPVNGARIITNCALRTSLEPVPDQNLWVDHDVEGTAVDITSRLDQ